MGFKDGTANLKAEDADALDAHVWVGGDAPASRVAARRHLHRRAPHPHAHRGLGPHRRWATRSRRIGRHKAAGAPLGERDEFADAAQPSTGCPPSEPHPPRRAARPTTATRILRRGYSFTDGIDAALGPARRRPLLHRLPARPGAPFVALQRRLGANDALNEYIQHIGAGVFGVPPGVRRGGYVGEGLFA